MLTPTLNLSRSVILIIRRPLPRSRSSQQVVEALHQVLAAAFDRGAQHLGIGHHEIRGRHRVDELPRIEVDLLRGLVVETVHLLHRRLHPARGEEVALLDVVEDRVLGPGAVLEAPVAGGGLDDGLPGAAHEALGGGLPEFEIVLPERELRLHQTAGIRHQALGHLHEGLAEAERRGHVDAVRLLALQELQHQALAALGDLREVACELHGIGDVDVGISRLLTALTRSRTIGHTKPSAALGGILVTRPARLNTPISYTGGNPRGRPFIRRARHMWGAAEPRPRGRVWRQGRLREALGQ